MSSKKRATISPADSPPEICKGPEPTAPEPAAPETAASETAALQAAPHTDGRASENVQAAALQSRLGRPATPDPPLGERLMLCVNLDADTRPASREPDADPATAPFPSAGLSMAAQEAGLPDPEALERLRGLVLGKEIAELADLRERFLDPEARAREVSEVVTEAIFLRTAKDDRLNTVLTPAVEHIFKENLRHNPAEIADELFPVMGPAIRRSIAESIRSMLQSFHKTLELGFSLKGLRWRLQALRTGKPFSEIVLLNTLVYRVEEIFLIHTKTGLVLEHLTASGVETQDADLVSGMLTALQDFVADCFARGTKDDALENLQLGDRKIFVIRSGQAYLACVVQGEPPLSLLTQLRSVLELILVECSKDFAGFKGDAAPFKKARRHLESCLVTQFADDGKALPLPIKLAPVAAALLIVGAFIYLKVQESAWLGELERLGQEPGIVITGVEPSLLGTWKVNMLQDTLAGEPEKFLKAEGLPLERFNLISKPYLSLDDQMVRLRVMDAVTPPPGVEMYLDADQVLHLKGEANMGWILATREKAMSIAGVKGVDTKEIIDPRTGRLRQLVNRVEGLEIYFPSGKAAPAQEDMQNLTLAVDTLVQIERLAQEMGLAVNLIIYGHADATGSDKLNYDLSQERAKTLAAMLYSRGSSIPIATYGMGADHAARAEGRPVSDPNSRKIELRVKLSQSGTAMPDFVAD